MTASNFHFFLKTTLPQTSAGELSKCHCPDSTVSQIHAVFKEQKQAVSRDDTEPQLGCSGQSPLSVPSIRTFNKTPKVKEAPCWHADEPCSCDPLLWRMSKTSEGTDVTCMHPYPQTQAQWPAIVWTQYKNINKQVNSTTYTWTARMEKFKVPVEGWSVCLCPWVWPCFTVFLMDYINPYADWKKPVLFPHGQLTYCCLFVGL